MSSLAIIKPLQPVAVQVSTPGMERMITPDPKEAFFFPDDAIDRFVDFDFGVPVQIDSLFVGYHDALTSQLVAFQGLARMGDDGGSSLFGNGYMGLAPKGVGPPDHAFYQFPIAQQPDSGLARRFWRVRFNNNGGGGNWYVGVLALGLAMQLQWGTEWGSGRSIDDTGTATRLFGGGFSIEDGASAGGYQWTFGDIQPGELDPLYQLVKERRTTRPVLIVENPDQTDGLNARIHWGLFRKLEAYTRLDPLNTKWSLQIGDWA